MADRFGTFVFHKWTINAKARKIFFHYTVKHDNTKLHFTESLHLPSSVDFESIPQELLEGILNDLLLMLGISYWKLLCPHKIEISSFSLTKRQATFWNTVYTKGLGEFFYKNKINYKGLIQFPFDKTKTELDLLSFPRKNRSIVPIGGGKDSVVAGEMLKKINKEFSTAIIHSGHVHEGIQEQIANLLQDKKAIVLQRTLDPKLLTLNKQKGALNGHVPSVAIYSFLSVFLAALYDYRFVIFANEASASYGNVEYLGKMVNHQWSKSWEFEKLFSEYLKTFRTKDIVYFSLLRPFSEIKIAKLFSTMPAYFPLFVSCNKGYTIRKSSIRWCGKCPKCAFVFCLLAAFLSKEDVLSIFGKNLFDEKTLLPYYRELLGIKTFKPFECVGTPEEVRLAFYYAFEKKEWGETKAMQVFIKQALPHMKNIKEQELQLFSTGIHHIPSEFSKALDL